MDLYALYFVGTARPRPGKSGEAAEWWREKGEAFYALLPGVKSLRTFAIQFGLGADYALEFWYEIEDFSVMDEWDKAIAADPGHYGPTLKEFADLFEAGQSRMMGTWPESLLID